jgi:GNAT superfamily N-acetyltransferase
MIEEQVYRHPELPAHLAQQVFDFTRIVWSDGFTEEDRLRQHLHDTPDAVRFVRIAGDLLVSHVAVIPVSVPGRDGPVLIGGVSGVMTYPQFRGEGHATALMGRAAEHLERSAADLGMLFCSAANVPFYERLGWRPLERGRVLVGGSTPGDDVVMVIGGDAPLPDVLELEWSW